MAAVQARMIHGGENLLDKFEQQAELLKASEVEVEEVRKEQERLRAEIVHKEDEQVQIEEKFSTVEDEIAGKTKKMKKVFGKFSQIFVCILSFLFFLTRIRGFHLFLNELFVQISAVCDTVAFTRTTSDHDILIYFLLFLYSFRAIPNFLYFSFFPTRWASLRYVDDCAI